jgi:phosphoribosylformimino-5-aminoimidazole carboxamide ribotide isomerase
MYELNMFRILFVLDVFNRTVVHAQGGDRREYKPIHFSSRICDSSDAVRIVDTVRPREVYIADLNLLQRTGKREQNFELIREVSQKARTMVDAGITSFSETQDILEIAPTIVLGTETASIDIIEDVATNYPGRAVVSIDKKYGRILTRDPAMPEDPFEIVKMLNGLDLRDIIILDLDRVGTTSGVDSQFLSKIASLSEHSVLLGGGVRNIEDIETLEKIGLEGALVATALHNGSLPLEKVQ